MFNIRKILKNFRSRDKVNKNKSFISYRAFKIINGYYEQDILNSRDYRLKGFHKRIGYYND